MKFVRVSAIVILCILTLAVALFFGLTVPLDRSPLLGSVVATGTQQLMNQRLRTGYGMTTESGLLRIGYAARNITPPMGLPTYGYSSRRGKGIEEVADSVYVRTLAISAGGGTPVVLLTADICLWDGTIADAIAESLRTIIPGQNLFFGATHTHSGPGGYADGPLAALLMGARNEELCSTLVSRSVSAVRKASETLADASYRVLATRLTTALFNRTRAEDPVDDEATMIEFATASRRLAVVFFGAHPTTVAADPVVCSADYPGVLCSELRAQGYGDVMFLASSTASAGPMLEGQRAVGPGTAIAEALGRSLAESLHALSSGNSPVFTNAIELETFRAPILLPPIRLRCLGRMVRPGLTSWLAGGEPPQGFVHAVRLDSLVIIGHSFEFSAVTSRILKERFHAWGGKLAVTGFNGRHYLYMVPDQYFDDEGLEPSLSLFGPGLGSYLERITGEVYAFMKAPDRNSRQVSLGPDN